VENRESTNKNLHREATKEMNGAHLTNRRAAGCITSP